MKNVLLKRSLRPLLSLLFLAGGPLGAAGESWEWTRAGDFDKAGLFNKANSPWRAICTEGGKRSYECDEEQPDECWWKREGNEMAWHDKKSAADFLGWVSPEDEMVRVEKNRLRQSAAGAMRKNAPLVQWINRTGKPLTVTITGTLVIQYFNCSEQDNTNTDIIVALHSASTDQWTYFNKTITNIHIREESEGRVKIGGNASKGFLVGPGDSIVLGVRAHIDFGSDRDAYLTLNDDEVVYEAFPH